VGVGGEEAHEGAPGPCATRKGLSGGLLSVTEKACERRAGESLMVLQFLRMSSRRVLARLRMSCDDCDGCGEEVKLVLSKVEFIRDASGLKYVGRERSFG
jgi:hypothetical protein